MGGASGPGGAGRATKGYRNHPQLRRFQDCADPSAQLAAYLQEVLAESLRRGYNFDAGKIAAGRPLASLPVTRGQLAYEWAHLRTKLRIRDPRWLEPFGKLEQPDPHPRFRVVPGGIAPWASVPE